MSEDDSISLAIWDVPMPVVAGQRFQIKVGAKAASGRMLADSRIEVIDESGAAVACGALSDKPWADTEALYWTALDVPAPSAPGLAEYVARLPSGNGAPVARFSIVAAAKPEHTLTITVTERGSSEALAGVEIRLGPFHGRTDREGRTAIRVCKGSYQLLLWRTAHIASPQPLTVDGDLTLTLTMLHVPEEHPDARWVR